MTPIKSLLTRALRKDRTGDDADLVLGLPLSVDDRTIYPVFVDGGHEATNGTAPHQIGYLDISGDRSDFVSLESDVRWPAVLAGLSFLVLGMLLIVRRVAARNR